MNKILEEIKRVEKMLDKNAKSRWLWGYYDGLKEALALMGYKEKKE